jgi:hypothetical protein
MNIADFRRRLNENPNVVLGFQFANGNCLAPHFHVTEVGKVTKDFVDCGGTRRSLHSCVLQTYVASDFDHRLTASKLSGILDKAAALGLDDDLPVELEIQTDSIAVFEIDNATMVEGKLQFRLVAKRTACLAPDKCGLEVLSVIGNDDCSGETGCC